MKHHDDDRRMLGSGVESKLNVNGMSRKLDRDIARPMPEFLAEADLEVNGTCPGRRLHPSPWLTARSTKSSIIGRIGCRNQLVKRHERPVFDNSRVRFGVN